MEDVGQVNGGGGWVRRMEDTDEHEGDMGGCVRGNGRWVGGQVREWRTGGNVRGNWRELIGTYMVHIWLLTLLLSGQ